MHTPDLAALSSELPAWQGRTDAPGWRAAAEWAAAQGARLVALWGAPGEVHATYGLPEGLLWLTLPCPGDGPEYPDLSDLFPAAARMQRAVADLWGITACGAADTRPWLDHGLWPDSRGTRDYPFVQVSGDGVHEIPVGPVHAGIIEPGHFRFSVVGEKVLRLEARLGYTHKGISHRFTELAPAEAYRLAGRVSGDSTVAYAWAYCMALESATGTSVPERARWLRALLLERERVANHLGDLGALGNDAGFAVGLAQFSRLREDWLRLSKDCFGHRLLMDCVVPGGVTADLPDGTADAMRKQCDAVAGEVAELRTLYDGHAGLQDRFLGTGRVEAPLASRLGLTGLAGRASGIAADLRCDQPWTPYAQLNVLMATQRNGDVAARVAVRFDEVFESLRLIRELLEGLPAGPVSTPFNALPANARGAGRVEGWRGEVLVALALDEQGHRLRYCHCHDPSWHNWPVLEHAVMGNIVPDFPLINKSFNLSYSGHDL
ncbi:MAG: NADH-quinone oxidoreductase subunit C [Betaproteobacteria bacterium]|nr:NADH-quinone oxidoreductase subunit C [Betaproteobacteria bacterium]